MQATNLNPWTILYTGPASFFGPSYPQTASYKVAASLSTRSSFFLAHTGNAEGLHRQPRDQLADRPSIPQTNQETFFLFLCSGGMVAFPPPW